MAPDPCLCVETRKTSFFSFLSGILTLTLLMLQISSFLAVISIRTTSFLGFSYLFCSFLVNFGNLNDWFFRFSPVFRSFGSFTYLARQSVRLVFPVSTSIFDGFCFWGGVGYFPQFLKLRISLYANFVEIRLRDVRKGG